MRSFKHISRGATRPQAYINMEALCAAPPPPEALAHSPSQMPLSCPVAPPHLSASCTKTAAAARWWRGEEGARRPGPEGKVLRHVPWHVLRNVVRRVLHVLVLHVSPKGRRGGRHACVGRGFRLGRGPDLVRGRDRVRVDARRRMRLFPLKDCVRRVLYVLVLHVSTATATGSAAPTKGFECSKSAWRDDKETVDEENLGDVGVGGGSWGWGQATGV